MNPIRACGFDALDFISESGEIGGKNGWGDDDVLHLTRLRELQRLQGPGVSSTPAVVTSITMQLFNLSLDAASHCFMLGVSGWPNRAAGKGPAKGLLKRVNALPSGWKLLLINNSCSTDFSAGYPAISGSISARRTLLFTSKIRESFCVSRRWWRYKPAQIECWR